MHIVSFWSFLVSPLCAIDEVPPHIEEQKLKFVTRLYMAWPIEPKNVAVVCSFNICLRSFFQTVYADIQFFWRKLYLQHHNVPGWFNRWYWYWQEHSLKVISRWRCPSCGCWYHGQKRWAKACYHSMVIPKVPLVTLVLLVNSFTSCKLLYACQVI